MHGLIDGREGVWDTGARCVQQLLNSPGAADGEHFLQVLEWMQRFIKVPPLELRGFILSKRF